MQILLRLFPESPVKLSFSYYSELRAAIYQIMDNYDPEFTADLHHGKGFQNRIKLFGFSPLDSKQTELYQVNAKENKNGGLIFYGLCTFVACSPWPELMSRIEQGARELTSLRIGSQLLNLQSVMMVPPPNFKERMEWTPRKNASVVTHWSIKGFKKKTFAMPDDPAHEMSCVDILRKNIMHKWERLKEIRPDIAQAWLNNNDDVQEKDILIKVDANYHRKSHHIKKSPVFSWKAPIMVEAPIAIQRLIWSAGLGQMNSMGFGVVQEIL